jgi:uncharacterized membrane protein YhaH (DUF805 family)
MVGVETMDFVTSVKTCLIKFVEFKGRAVRSEYWYFHLAYFVAAISLLAAGLESISTFLSFVLLLPSIAVSVRRLHDIDKSGWWLLIIFVPILGSILLIVWSAQRGTVGENRFGADPFAQILVA